MNNDYIRNAFKSLEDLKVVIEPVKTPLLHEDVDLEPEEDNSNKTIADLFKEANSYILTKDFDCNGKYVMFMEALHDGESCDILYDEFDVENINEVLFEILDEEHDFIDSLHATEFTLDSKFEDVVKSACSQLNGEPGLEDDGTSDEQDEHDKNVRDFVGDEEPKDKDGEGDLPPVEVEMEPADIKDAPVEDEQEVEEAWKDVSNSKSQAGKSSAYLARAALGGLLPGKGDYTVEWDDAKQGLVITFDSNDLKVDDVEKTVRDALGKQQQLEPKDREVAENDGKTQLTLTYWQPIEGTDLYNANKDVVDKNNTDFTGDFAKLSNDDLLANHKKMKAALTEIKKWWDIYIDDINNGKDTDNARQMLRSLGSKKEKAEENLQGLEAEIESRGLTMPDVKLTFEALDESSKFNLQDEQEVQEASDILNKEEGEAIEQIVDAAAETQDDLQKTYIGSIILQCPTCKTMIYKNPDQLVKSEDADDVIYNVDEECPHCGAKDGFELIGQVASLSVNPDGEQTPPSDTTPEDNPEDKPEESEESKEPASPMPELPSDDKSSNPDDIDVNIDVHESLKEDTVKQGDKWVNKGDEGTHGEFKTKKEADAQRKAMFANGYKEECEDGKCNVKLESFDEVKYDKLISRYLKENYANVKTYKTVSADIDDAANKIMIEGVILFKSGKEKNTKFVFEAKEITKKNQIKFVGINETFSKSKAYTLLGQVNNNKLISESLSYNYTAGDRKVRGKIEPLRKR